VISGGNEEGETPDKAIRRELYEEAGIVLSSLKELDIEEPFLKESKDVLAQLEQALQNHDWYYRYSDDHKEFKKGSLEEENIINLLHLAKKSGLENKAQNLYNQYSPFNK
jgi:8-oxo-dGTP pyrophosphatase MutT (NUDIX family)